MAIRKAIILSAAVAVWLATVICGMAALWNCERWSARRRVASRVYGYALFGTPSAKKGVICKR